jgi:hypothetical protein
VDLLASYTSIDTFSSAALPGDAPELPVTLGNRQPIVPPPLVLDETAPPRASDEWTEGFARSLQTQHARIREFLQSRNERWRQMAARFTRQIEKLQAEVETLTAANDVLRAERAMCAAETGPSEESEEASQRYLAALDEVNHLKARNAELQRQLRTASAAPPRSSAVPPADNGDWESQKRRLLAELESDDGRDEEALDRRLKIEEVIAQTDKIIAEKDREIEELQHLLSNQSGSLGSLAVGAAALDEVFNQDEIIREERERLQQAHEELRANLRQAEIEHAMERARLARREAELDERFRTGESRNATPDGDAEALAPTGRPVRGRWRTQMGLADDDPPNFDRNRR